MTAELIAIMALYTFWIIPRVALKTNNLFEQRMLDKTWDIPAMLEDYTTHLEKVFAEIIKKMDLKEVFSVLIKELVPSIIGGHMTAGTKQLRADPENLVANVTADFLDELPPSAQMVARMILPRIQEAIGKSATSPDEATVSYNPGLNRP